MLHKATTLQHYKLDSLDGEMGIVKEFYFDDRSWAIRYMVADTGTWLRGRQVLISPHALVAAIPDEKHIAIDLTRRQIEESPSLETDEPVSRQFEREYHGHYGWGGFWMGGYPMMGTSSPGFDPTTFEDQIDNPPREEHDPHLRSSETVRGSDIEATDGVIGHIDDFIIDDNNWTIRYLVIDTKNWWPGKKVLVSPEWIERLSWADSKVFLNLTREAIEHSPEYSDEELLTREYETNLHIHYQREGYWTKTPPADTAEEE